MQKLGRRIPSRRTVYTKACQESSLNVYEKQKYPSLGRSKNKMGNWFKMRVENRQRLDNVSIESQGKKSEFIMNVMGNHQCFKQWTVEAARLLQYFSKDYDEYWDYLGSSN